MTEKEAHITVRDLTMAYGDFVLMRDLTFTINRGDIFIVMGGSGCGKSTLLHIIGGLESVTSGRVFLDGCDLASLREPERTRFRRDRVGVVFQSFNLLPLLTLEENVALPRVLQGAS